MRIRTNWAESASLRDEAEAQAFSGGAQAQRSAARGGATPAAAAAEPEPPAPAHPASGDRRAAEHQDEHGDHAEQADAEPGDQEDHDDRDGGDRVGAQAPALAFALGGEATIEDRCGRAAWLRPRPPGAGSRARLPPSTAAHSGSFP